MCFQNSNFNSLEIKLCTGAIEELDGWPDTLVGIKQISITLGLDAAATASAPTNNPGGKSLLGYTVVFLGAWKETCARRRWQDH